MAFRILYVAPLTRGATSLNRFRALERLQQDLIPFDLAKFDSKSKIVSALRYRLPVGPLVAKVNAALLETVRNQRPTVVWFDRPTVFTPETVRAVKASGALTVCFNMDNPFGPRNDGCWHQFYKIYRLIDLHCLFRKADVSRYQGWGLNYIETQFSYDPVLQFAPPPDWCDRDRTREVSYIGHPHEERPQFLRTLIDTNKLPVVISGNGWQKVIVGEERQRLTRFGNLQDASGLLKEADYREAIWKSKINLSFVTHLNEDDVAHKSFEIAACRGFLLALRSPGHEAAFQEGREAEFFSSVEECAEKINYYLAHPAEREQIALRGWERAMRSGYDNDTQLSRILARLEQMRGGDSTFPTQSR
jgi:hypothetical protein